jgi:hypothetical protein
VSRGIAAGTLLLGTSGLSGPVLRSERQAGWLLDFCGVGGGLRVTAACGAVGLYGLLFGAAHGLLVGWFLGGGPQLLIRLGLGAALCGGTLGMVACCATRSAVRGDKKDGNRVHRLLIFGLLALGLAAGLSWALKEWVLVVWVLLAVVLTVRTAATLMPSGRWLRLQQERQQGDA